MHILVIGGGISGLICAKHLIEHISDIHITIIEEKAEVGHPQNRPGTINNKSLLTNFNTPIQLGKNGCRRPWVSKTIAQQISSNGVTINVRSRLVSIDPLLISGAGPFIEDIFNIIVNTTNKKFNSKRPLIFESRTNEISFNGGITTVGKNIGNPKIYSSLSDGLVECWYHGTIPEMEGGWLERMTGKFSEEEASIDASFARGHRLAESTLNLISQSS